MAGTPRWRHLAAVMASALAWALAVFACAAPPDPPDAGGPAEGQPQVILLITVDALRADAVGALSAADGVSATPHLDALAARSRWAGRAVAPASETAPALASLLTGLRPWQHGVLHGGAGQLTLDVRTLAEALHQRGFATHAYVSGHWPSRGSGYQQGFDSYRATGRGKRASGHLESLGDEPTFVWVHLDTPRPPYRLRPQMAERFRDTLPNLPQRLTQRELETYRNPRRPMPAQLRERLWPLYLSNVTRLDRQVGRLLEAAATSPAAERTAVIFTSLLGPEFGEQGQVGHGNNLGRAALEVPLMMQVPAASSWRPPAPGATVGTRQLAATVLQWVGAAVPPALAPSLGEGPSTGVVSEHYLGNGVNLFSLVDGDVQLLRRVRFAPAEAEYFAARRAAVLRRGAQGSLEEPPDVLFDRLEARFLGAPPFTGVGEPVVHQLFAWPREPADGPTPSPRRRDPDLQRRLARDLEHRWRAFSGAEVPPAQWVHTVP